ncbi:ergothioneine biosynthesis protein EgtB [Chryseosolibacter histidini]|nr:ergothioneine biosynthesis protein EgtB [Chryseosolibacter histidini]
MISERVMRGLTADLQRFTRKATRKAPSKATLTERYSTIRRYSEYVCEPLATEDYVVQPSADVSPPKWHLAHTTWFFEEFILARYYKNYTRFHPQYSFLFNSYYESVGTHVLRADRGNLSRPTVEEIFQYRGYVDEHMHWLLRDFPAEALPILEIGFNHEQQHQELLYTDIKFILGHNPLFPAYRKEIKETPHNETDHDFISISDGRYTIGHRGSGFSYDNERAAHTVLLKAFSIRKSLVTNGEYMQFMQAGGYQRPEYWLSDGWAWVKEEHITSPMYWHFTDGTWCRYALSGLERVNPEEPVTHVSFYEAAAFATWKGMRLPTEEEWEAAAPQLPWGLRWEHTNSAYLPYPGYEKPDGALGEYNEKFMINTMVLRGASAVTPENHSRKTYRNFFYPHLRWQFNGIRLCKK